MSSILLPYGSQKPPLGSQLDRNHPLSRGLVGCWLLNAGVGVPRDLFNPGGVLTPGGSPPPAWIATPGGTGINGSTGYYTSGPNQAPNLASHDFSVVTLASSTLTGGTNHTIVSFGDNGGSTDHCVHLRFESSSQLRFAFYADDFDVDVSPMTAGALYGIAATFGTANKLQSVYLNGALQGTRTASGVFSGGQYLSLGCDVWVAGQNLLNGSLVYVFLYNRTLSAGEIASLYAAPYQMVQAPSMYRYLVPGGGGGATLTPPPPIIVRQAVQRAATR
jgi:hypothetical protein